MNKKLINLLIIVCLVVAVGGILYFRIANSDGLSANTLAVVNGVKITGEYYQTEYASMSADMQSMFEKDKVGFLDELILKELLYQDAINKQITLTEEEAKVADAKNTYITKVFDQIFATIEVTDQEKKDFYAANQDLVQGMEYAQVENSIGQYLIQQKYNAEIERFITEVQDKATIVKNEKWLAANKPEDPVEELLKNGKPTVLDLGSTTCVPCQMMQPILEELTKEYEGKANVVVIDVYEYRHLATKYEVRGIPTQIFFDQDGNQVWRHEGFLAKEDIVKKLEELGVDA